jgi:hypothetical protein
MAKAGERVLHLRRHGRIDRARNHAVALAKALEQAETLAA